MTENAAQNGQATPRQPSLGAVVDLLNNRLNEKAQQIRLLEDREVFLMAVVKDLEAENAELKSQLEMVPEPTESSLDTPLKQRTSSRASAG